MRVALCGGNNSTGIAVAERHAANFYLLASSGGFADVGAEHVIVLIVHGELTRLRRLANTATAQSGQCENGQ